MCVCVCALVGRSKGKQPSDKLPLLALQCLDALLRLGRTCEGVAELLQEVSMPADAKPPKTSPGAGSCRLLFSQFYLSVALFLEQTST